MSGYFRLCFVSLVLVEILSTAPASSNPLADLFNTAAAQPSVTSPPQAECLGSPGNSAPDGQHWVYRLDGHRKCWFLTEAPAKVKKTVRRRMAKDSNASLDESGTPRPRQSGVLDARAELLRSTPPLPPQPPRPELKVADAGSENSTSTVLTSAALIAQNSRRPMLYRPTQDHQVDVEQLLAATPTNDVTSSEPRSVSVDPRLDGNGAVSRTATWLGVLLIMLGMLSILSSSRSLRRAAHLRY
ncbi:hypothetical protein SAMN05216573_13218 [Bradyrhizobium sp. Rc3b]|uniref:hypothetical protein n=1 Tax=Bradyrhizobium sp. Rc3b TaxID=1855322 RepID=UPI0008EA8F81|nr:hypothetical protein [Bradyrhizobium sp. Rc3b]SFN95791.1 hypothetical protein SAMN05216573_13218 [Bradyrhizobium sp. Rc3b]